ncbi:MAG: ribonuclease E/G [Eubacteriales bacterium]|nr:ribonuclease E/G [Eubacteriales bacterium]
MSKLIIAGMQIHGIPCLCAGIYDQNRMQEIRLIKEEETSILGNIYVAQVENILENIQAAFVMISPMVRCYMPLKEVENLIYGAGKSEGKALRPGDQILVQVSREAMKSKLPSVTSNLNLTGQYLILTTGDKSAGISKKLPRDQRERLKEWMAKDKPEIGRDFGMIVRTNGANVSAEELDREYEYLKGEFLRVAVHGRNRTCYSLLYRQDLPWRNLIRDTRKDTLEEIVTDVREVAKDAGELISRQDCIRFYEDPLLPLHKLYRMEMILEEIKQEKVWLRSGGFLVIQQTEAFVSVDVNSGKYDGRKKAEETFRKVNLEAAAEIAHQIRLRNLSGSILIDFINLENPDHKEELFHVLQKHLKKDPVRTRAIDITALNIMEVTRQKVRKPVIEELRAMQ